MDLSSRKERLEKKRSRKSGIARWTGGGSSSTAEREMPNMDSMMISPKTPSSAMDPKKGRPSHTPGD